MFSPWRYNIDATARALLERSGWRAPDPDRLPTGNEIVRDYLEPLALLPQIASNLSLSARVTAITRAGVDKVRSTGRDATPFLIRFIDGEGTERELLASAILDASGTWTSPNPMGADGLPVIGEMTAASRIIYGIPDVSGPARRDYADKRILVVGSGHSAINVVLALLEVQKNAPSTRIFWAMRRSNREKLFGGGLNDQLPARGALGIAARQAIANKKLKMLAPIADGYGLRQGVLMVPARFAQAAAPFLFAVLMELYGAFALLGSMALGLAACMALISLSPTTTAEHA